MSGQRRAMIIANDEFEDEGLRRLMAPAADAAALSKVLGDPGVGDFDVQVVYNQPSYIIQTRIEDLLAESRPEDVLLLHFSCHGLKSESGELFFAARNTRPNRLSSTATPADFVQRCMRASRSRTIVLLLDCCYGGAFSQGVKVRASGDVNVLDAFPTGRLGGGRGRAVITASSAMEYAFEGDQLTEDSRPRPSLFTKALVDGLASGDADRDEDGWISLSELYDYVFDRVRGQNPHQTPSRDVEMQGEMYMARSRRGRIRAVPLPPDLDAARKDQNIYTRRGTVEELRSRLLSDNLPAAIGAFEALAELANDIDYVAANARAALDEAAVRPAETRVNFGQVLRGAPSPHRAVPLLGPPIARACKAEAAQRWIHVRDVPDGLEVWVDTTPSGLLAGRISLKGPSGEATLTVDVDLVESPPPAPEVKSAPPVTSTQLTPTSATFPPEAPAQAKHAGQHRPASRRTLSYAKSLAIVLWALLPVISIGLLTPILAPIPFCYAASRLTDQRLWLSAAIYGIGSLILWILWIVAIENKWTAASLAFYFVLIALSVVATVHAFRLRRLVFGAARPSAA